MSYKKLFLLLCLGIFLSYGRNANAQTQTFNYTGTLQTWTVPCATSITITATGAEGGVAPLYGAGGLGAKIVGTFAVIPGNVLDIVVGQEATYVAGPYYSAGGGGGTYVWNSASTTLPMIVAGGGGGGADASTPGAGSATTTPTASTGSGCGAGGTGGNGGSGGGGSPDGNISTGGGGAGWISNGQNGTQAPFAGGGFTPLNGAAGGAAGSPGAAGSYGGGGGCVGNSGAGGGGGGYNGGGGGNEWNGSAWGAGGGGGSYNGGTNPSNTAGVNTGNGSVTITWTVANIPVTCTGVVYQNENTCNGQTGIAYAQVTGVGLTYSWTGGQTKDTATGLSAGSYMVTVVSACGGSASASVTITQPANVISVTTTVNKNVLCNGGNNGSITATVAGVGAPYTYTWTPAGGNAATANGLTAGLYTVKVINACGATASATAIITQPASLSIIASTTANITCFGNNNGSVFGLVGLNSGTPPYRYAWSPVGGNSDTSIGLTAGTYTVNLTDANGCTGSAKTTITQPNVLTVSATTPTNVLCNSSKTGSTASTVNGGTGPYLYSWTGGQTNAGATSLPAGTYTVNVTDAHGCTTSAQTTITQPTALKVITNTTVDSGYCTGSAWVVVSGGVVPYSYLWNNTSTSYYIPDVCGTKKYCCTITDAQGCSDTECVDVNNVLGVNNITASAGKVTVYPNPTSGQFTIESSVTGGGAWSVEVYNVLGEKVYSQASIHTATSNINLGNQANGIYLYRVISNENGNLVGEGKIVLEK